MALSNRVFDGGSIYPSAAPTAPAAPTDPGSLGYDWLKGLGTISGSSFTPNGGSAGPIPNAPAGYGIDAQQAANNANASHTTAINNPSQPSPLLPAVSIQPPTVPGLGGFGGGFNASNDPNVADSLALEQQGIGQLDAALKSAREKAIIGFGDPSMASEAGFGIDPQAGAFARQNYLSGNATTARLDKAHNLARQAVINQLASHGILNSGDLGYQEGNADQSYGNQLYDAKNQLLDYLSNLFNSYNQNRTNLHQATIAARQNALNAFASNPDAYAQFFGS